MYIVAVRKLKSGKWVADVTVGVKWDGSRDRRVETCQTKGQARRAETRLLMEKERLRGRVTATNARETLSSVLGCAVEMGMLPVNSASFRYTCPGGAADPERGGEWLTTFGDHERLLGHLRETRPGSCVERICVIGLCEGLRKGEVLALRWADVDFTRRELTVRGTYTQGLGGAHETDPKNRNARRTIPLRAYAAERMAAWGPGEGPIVESVGGGLLSPVTAGERMRRFTAGSCPDGTPLPCVTMASLRHGFATACVNEGMEVSKLSRIMGHADIKVAVDAMDGGDVGNR